MRDKFNEEDKKDTCLFCIFFRLPVNLTILNLRRNIIGIFGGFMNIYIFFGNTRIFSIKQHNNKSSETGLFLFI